MSYFYDDGTSSRMYYHGHQIIGTCSLCGGNVTVPSMWLGVNPPTPTCSTCGATRSSQGPVIPMTLPRVPMAPNPMTLSQDALEELTKFLEQGINQVPVDAPKKEDPLLKQQKPRDCVSALWDDFRDQGVDYVVAVGADATHLVVYVSAKKYVKLIPSKLDGFRFPIRVVVSGKPRPA